MSWLTNLLPRRVTDNSTKSTIPEGVWIKCAKCEGTLYRANLESNQHVCPSCGHHMRLKARQRLLMLFEEGSTYEIGADIESKDILNFKDTKRYKERIATAQKKTGEKNALIVMSGRVQQITFVAAAFEFSFLGGSMGAAVGERFVQAVEYCIKNKLPFVCFSASGGARMQEALVSLMQMAKTSAALAKLAADGLPYISVLTDPTTGGVSASLAMLGDIILAEPNALIGFTGPRVIEQTVRQALPEGFQRSEFLLNHGAIDQVVHRHDMAATLVRLLSKLSHHIHL